LDSWDELFRNPALGFGGFFGRKREIIRRFHLFIGENNFIENTNKNKIY
jgi:hypothetical protein